MVKKTLTPSQKKRKPRILWANPFCLLDTSSGASMTVRQMLKQLIELGYEVKVLGATIFDNPKGTMLFKEKAACIKGEKKKLITIEDDTLDYQLVVTKNSYRNELTSAEESKWFSQYCYMLDSFKPDVVWFYGGQTLDLLISDEARSRNIPSAFYLANGNYTSSPRWCRDIDLILCDSQATSDMYRDKVGFVATPLGKFIDPQQFVVEHREPKRLLFVNPSFEKGASIVIQLALHLEKVRPDIEIEVVEARADWQQVVRTVTQKLGEQRRHLPNVTVTPNTSNMRGPYSRARVLLAPSLWWESSGRVLAEAMLNGIPAIVTNRGGMPEMIDDAGIKLDFPEACYEKPYQHLLSEEELEPLITAVTSLFDDEALYQTYVERATHVGREKHHIDVSTKRLTQALAPLVAKKAGNKDFRIPQRKHHKHNLAGIAAKPTFSSEVYVPPASAEGAIKHTIKAPAATSTPKLDFDWQLSSNIVVLDNRAKLLKTGNAEKLANTQAFSIIAFDPASEVEDPKQYEGHEHIQVFQHALLGDGQPAILHTCLAPEMSSTLAPLPEAQLPEHRRQEAKLITKLPINTVALDSIEGLPSLDWLILDDLSDSASILSHGENALKETLLIQTRVAFQPTHEKQPNLAELQHWASRNGFRFYRFNDIQHHSHIPKDLNTQQRPATEQESADVLFLPNQERMSVLTDQQKLKLAFLLSTVFEIYDFAYELIEQIDLEQSKRYLVSNGILSEASLVPTLHKVADINDVGQILDEVVFVVGCGHSGTTLLASMLGAHPDIYSIERETYWFLTLPYLEKEYPVEKLKCIESGKSIVCEKTPRHIYKIYEIKSKFPNAKFVAITRNSKDVVASLKNRSDDFSKSLRRWLNDNCFLSKFLDKDFLLKIKYEDLIENKEAEMEKVLNFIGVSYSNEVFDFYKKGYSWYGINGAVETDGKGEVNHVVRRSWQMTQPLQDRRGIWTQHLNSKEAKVVDKATRELMLKLGYDDEDQIK